MMWMGWREAKRAQSSTSARAPVSTRRDLAEGFVELVDQVVVVLRGGVRVAGDGLEGEAAGDAQDDLAGGVKVVGQAVEGVAGADMALVQDVAHCGHAHAGVDGDGVCVVPVIRRNRTGGHSITPSGDHLTGQDARTGGRR